MILFQWLVWQSMIMKKIEFQGQCWHIMMTCEEKTKQSRGTEKEDKTGANIFQPFFLRDFTARFVILLEVQQFPEQYIYKHSVCQSPDHPNGYLRVDRHAQTMPRQRCCLFLPKLTLSAKQVLIFHMQIWKVKKSLSFIKEYTSVSHNHLFFSSSSYSLALQYIFHIPMGTYKLLEEIKGKNIKYHENK